MVPVLIKTLRAFNIDNTLKLLKKSFHLSRNVSMMHTSLSQVKDSFIRINLLQT